ncbi:hypothetical protein BN938_2269 [Mucinivorans hirudinis]|uniref:DUF5655 domain-containing protein n=1 Tax=Mucinivorans hirudinis TaxID=1433126 RepID=A0A060R9Q2_9BACT|nr:hypothetical protein BN938_2269 [Mucinivorans hirudinis]
MAKLFSSRDNKILMQVDKPEKDLRKIICGNWNSLFPQLVFIAEEFPLKGAVRSSGTSGFVDIVAYNPSSKRFVVFELKKDYDKNITDQAADYRDFMQEHFSDMYLNATQKYDITLPKFTELNQNQVEVILVAKKYSITQIERVKKIKENNFTLIKYFWFENDLIFIDYQNNDPDDIKIESTNTKKIADIKNIINQSPDYYEIEKFFGLKPKAKEAFTYFYDFLKGLTKVDIEAQQSKMKIVTEKTTFSAVGLGGKSGRKSILQINTNINILDLSEHAEIIYEDRYRGEGVKKKGSLGSERYEVFIRNMDEIREFCDFLKMKLS